MSPQLKRIDLSKQANCDHPDIKTYPTQYLAKIFGRWHAGSFTRQWFGLLFDVGTHRMQLDSGRRCTGTPDGWDALFEVPDGWCPEIDVPPKLILKPKLREFDFHD
jgi:hypothetical protein